MKKLSLALVLFLALFISGCNKDKAKEEKLSTAMHTVTDMAGRKVSLPKDIKSVVTLGATPVINSFIMALGEQSKIINGLPAFANKPSWKYEFVFAPNIKNAPIIQGKNKAPMVEKLLRLNPDVIFVLAFQTSIANELAKKGLRVVVLDWKTYADVKPLMLLLGDIFNKEKQAKEYLAYFDGVIKKAHTLTASIKPADKVSVLYTTLKNLSQPHLIAEWWIRTAGGRSVTDNGRKSDRYSYSLEQLLKWNPDIIIVSTKSDKKQLYSDERFAQLKALKDNKVYIAPTGAHKWAHCTIEQPLTVLWALNKFYPALYTTSELEKDVGDFYERFFKTKLSKDQIAEIIEGLN